MVRSSRKQTETTLEAQELNHTEADTVDFKIIKVSPATHKRLLTHGVKSETFDQIINRALDALDEKEGA